MSRAIYDMCEVAALAHHGQERKGLPEPYVIHCLRVARAAEALGMDEDCQVAALGHDILEDTTMPASTLVRAVTPRAFQLIRTLTKWWGDSDPVADASNKAQYYSAILQDTDAIWLKILDRTDNLCDMRRMASRPGCHVSLRKWAARYVVKTEKEFVPLIAAAVASRAHYAQTPAHLYIVALGELKDEIQRLTALPSPDTTQEKK